MSNSYPWEHTLSSLTKDLLIDNLSSVFIETGTNTGFGVNTAINSGFKSIYSIDIEEKFIDAANKNFNTEKYPDVKFNFLLGDSGEIFKNLLPTINEKITFWLDGHSFHQIPLLNELTAIKNHHIKEHILIIDDVRMFDTSEWDNIGSENVFNLVMEINKNYKISYHDSVNGKNDILIAKVVI